MEKKNQVAKDYIMNIILSSPVGTKIPSERELVSHLNLSRPTIQHAIEYLTLSGYLYKVDRQGTFVAKNYHCTSLNRMRSFNEDAYEQGLVPCSEIIEQSTLIADAYIAAEMNCPIGEKIHYFLRLRKHSNIPVMLEYSYFCDFAIAGITKRAAQQSIYQFIEQVKRLSLGSSSATIAAALPEEEVALRLKVSLEEPLILIERFSRLNDGRIFEHTTSYLVSRHNKLSVNSIRGL